METNKMSVIEDDKLSKPIKRAYFTFEQMDDLKFMVIGGAPREYLFQKDEEKYHARMTKLYSYNEKTGKFDVKKLRAKLSDSRVLHCSFLTKYKNKHGVMVVGGIPIDNDIRGCGGVGKETTEFFIWHKKRWIPGPQLPHGIAGCQSVVDPVTQRYFIIGGNMHKKAVLEYEKGQFKKLGNPPIMREDHLALYIPSEDLV